jgi:hypothetical protein
MEITQEHRRQIEEIIKDTECPRDFKCYKSDFEDLAKIRIFRGGELIECFEERSNLCKFSFNFGRGYYCKCPLRRYIAQNFNR